MENKHKIKLARLANALVADHQAKLTAESERRTLDDHFVEAFKAAMKGVVVPAFDEYQAELKALGLSSHIQTLPAMGPNNEQLPGLAFVFSAKPPAQTPVSAVAFKIMPHVKSRTAVPSYTPVASSEVQMGPVGINQVTVSWIHEQLNSVLEKVGD